MARSCYARSPAFEVVVRMAQSQRDPIKLKLSPALHAVITGRLTTGGTKLRSLAETSILLCLPEADDDFGKRPRDAEKIEEPRINPDLKGVVRLVRDERRNEYGLQPDTNGSIVEECLARYAFLGLSMHNVTLTADELAATGFSVLAPECAPLEESHAIYRNLFRSKHRVFDAVVRSVTSLSSSQSTIRQKMVLSVVNEIMESRSDTTPATLARRSKIRHEDIYESQGPVAACVKMGLDGTFAEACLS